MVSWKINYHHLYNVSSGQHHFTPYIKMCKSSTSPQSKMNRFQNKGSNFLHVLAQSLLLGSNVTFLLFTKIKADKVQVSKQEQVVETVTTFSPSRLGFASCVIFFIIIYRLTFSGFIVQWFTYSPNKQKLSVLFPGGDRNLLRVVPRKVIQCKCSKQLKHSDGIRVSVSSFNF